MKIFAVQTTEDVNIYNLQTAFWRMAVNRIEELHDRTRITSGEFIELFPEFCAVLVLAGTSVSILLGQKYGNSGNMVPGPRALINKIQSPHICKATLLEFVDIYDALRHFGMPKHDLIIGITHKDFCRYFEELRKVWIHEGNAQRALDPSMFGLTLEIEEE